MTLTKCFCPKCDRINGEPGLLQRRGLCWFCSFVVAKDQVLMWR